MDCYDSWFWQPILSDFYSKPETSQAQKAEQEIRYEIIFPQTKLQHQSVLYVLLSSAKKILTHQK